MWSPSYAMTPGSSSSSSGPARSLEVCSIQSIGMSSAWLTGSAHVEQSCLQVPATEPFTKIPPSVRVRVMATLGGASKAISWPLEPSFSLVLRASRGTIPSMLIPENGMVVVQILIVKGSLPYRVKTSREGWGGISKYPLGTPKQLFEVGKKWVINPNSSNL